MRLRLFLSFALIVLIAIAGMVIGARINTAQAIENFMYRGGVMGLDQLVVDLEAFYRQHQSWEGSDRLFAPPLGEGRHMGGRGMGQHLQLLDAQGNLVFDNQGRGLSADADLARAIPLEVDGRVVGYLLPEGGNLFPPLIGQQLLERLNAAALPAALVAVAAALLLAFLLADTLMRPIRQLTAAAQRLAQGDLSQRVEIDGKDEITLLGRTFNQMAASLQQAEERRRALTADIAHELRNPLAVQRAHLEALQDGVYALTPENLTPIVEQNLLLGRLVEDLRTLALADAGQLTLERLPADVCALAAQAVTRFEPQAAERDIILRFTSQEQKRLLPVDSQRIEQILNNLLANALRYTPSGGLVEVRCSDSSDGFLQIAVRDSGPGIPAEALPHIFERFYKAEASRQGGTGLGLSIARKLAQAHGGDLIAANYPDGGALFTLRLPLE